MSNEYTLQTPLQPEDVKKLKLGDFVYLNGEIVTSVGIPAMARIIEHIEQGKPLPVDLNNAVFLHMGGFTYEENGKFKLAHLNPTTSTRFNPHMPTIIRTFNLRATGGKGGLDANSVQAMKDTGCVYLGVLGGSCAVNAPVVKEVLSVSWLDLLPHFRLAHLRVERLGPMIVAIDAHGNSLYQDIADAFKKKMPSVMKELEEARKAAL